MSKNICDGCGKETDRLLQSPPNQSEELKTALKLKGVSTNYPLFCYGCFEAEMVKVPPDELVGLIWDTMSDLTTTEGKLTDVEDDAQRMYAEVESMKGKLKDIKDMI